MEQVTVKLADSTLPAPPVQGGSWAAASAGSAVMAACQDLQTQLFKIARKIDGSPLADASDDDIAFANGRILLRTDPAKSMSLAEVLAASSEEKLEAEKTASPGLVGPMRYAAYTHSAVFAEVRIDEELGQIRVTRIVNAVAAGRILKA